MPRTPLRAAIEQQVASQRAFALTDISVSGATKRAIKCFLSKLVLQSVLVYTEVRTGASVGVSYCAGERAQDWLQQDPQTEPGGRAIRYLQAKAARDQIAYEDWLARNPRIRDMQRGPVC
jgi:hypothetical protein